MRYTLENGHVMVSGKEPVTYKGLLSADAQFTVGTFHSTETKSKSDGSLQQLNILRKYEEDGSFEVTITESNADKIQEYIESVKPIEDANSDSKAEFKQQLKEEIKRELKEEMLPEYADKSLKA